MRKDLLIAGIDFRRRANRRLACVAAYLGYALALAALSLAYKLGSAAWAFAILPGTLLLVGGWWVLNQVAVPYATATIDERQTQVRNQAFFRAYQFLASLSVVILFYLKEAPGVAAQRGWTLWVPQPGDGLSTGLMLGYVLLAVTLPHALIAWQDPDYLEADSPA